LKIGHVVVMTTMADLLPEYRDIDVMLFRQDSRHERQLPPRSINDST
jgi:hypothetical protein